MIINEIKGKRERTHKTWARNARRCALLKLQRRYRAAWLAHQAREDLSEKYTSSFLVLPPIWQFPKEWVSFMGRSSITWWKERICLFFTLLSFPSWLRSWLLGDVDLLLCHLWRWHQRKDKVQFLTSFSILISQVSTKERTRFIKISIQFSIFSSILNYIFSIKGTTWFF